MNPDGKWKCRCWQCCDDPAPSASEAFRLTCEARCVIAMQGKAERVAYLAKVKERRGDASCAALEAEIVQQWNQRRK